MDGLYEFNIKSPMGNIKVQAKLITNGNSLSGYIDVMGKRNEFTNGIVNGNNLSLSGSIPSAFTTIKYNIIGKVEGNTLNINAKTNMGNFNLQGNKVACQ